MGLSPEDYKALRRPFPAETVKFRIDGKPNSNGSVRILTYIDSRIAAERLSEVDPNWSGEPSFVGAAQHDGIGLAVGVPVAYHLNVKGVQRTDVGQIGPAQYGANKDSFEADDKHAKVAVSDALKRSAVLYGVGASLYALGNVYLDVDKYTSKKEGKYINDAGLTYLKKQYLKTVTSKEFVAQFGEIENSTSVSVTAPEPCSTETVDSGSLQKAADKSSKPAVDAPANDSNTPDFEAIVAGIFELLGRDKDAGLLWLENKKNKKTAVKNTVKKAVDKGIDSDILDRLLESNGLPELVGAY